MQQNKNSKWHYSVQKWDISIAHWKCCKVSNYKRDNNFIWSITNNRKLTYKAGKDAKLKLSEDEARKLYDEIYDEK